MFKRMTYGAVFTRTQIEMLSITRTFPSWKLSTFSSTSLKPFVGNFSRKWRATLYSELAVELAVHSTNCRQMTAWHSKYSADKIPRQQEPWSDTSAGTTHGRGAICWSFPKCANSPDTHSNINVGFAKKNEADWKFWQCRGQASEHNGLEIKRAVQRQTRMTTWEGTSYPKNISKIE